MKRGDPSVHLPQHAAHSLIRTNKLYGLTVIIVGFSITRTLRKSSHSTVNADVVHTRPFTEPVGLEQCTFSATRGQCCPLVGLAAETSPRACMFFEKQEERRPLIPTSVSVERSGSRSTNVLLFDHENAIIIFFFFNCENKSQFT